VITNFRGANVEVDAVEQAALIELVAQGAVLVPVSLPDEFENLWNLVFKQATSPPRPAFPEVTVPAGRISANMPVGYSFMGLPYSEGLLLR
jgi:Asp-tRNA(Asn)/Glu-tRNA(Gln) amidotransferase A subunit family amidase